MNIAHFFTLLRIVLIPFFPVCYLGYNWLKINPFYLPYILLFVLAICELTDLMDGYFARKKNQITDAGKILDPMADSITRILVFFTFTQGWVGIPLLLVFVFLYREFLISSLRTLCALKGFALAARKSGKLKAVLQASVNFFIVLLMIPYTWGTLSLSALQRASLIAVSIAAVYTVLSAVDYVYANRSYLKKVFYN